MPSQQLVSEWERRSYNWDEKLMYILLINVNILIPNDQQIRN